MSRAKSLPDPTFHNGVVRGWRAWNVAYGDLVSLSAPERWPHYARLEATHLAGSDGEHTGEAPCFDKLHCGIYAYQSPTQLHNHLQDQPAWGEVSLWGRIIRHEQIGFRAQYAYPSLVIVRDELAATLIRRNYGCEVIVDDRAPKQTVASTASAQTSPTAGVAALYASRVPQAVPGATLMVNMNLQWNGTNHNYQGRADAGIVAHWLEGVLGILFAQNGLQPNYQNYCQIQTQFWIA